MKRRTRVFVSGPMTGSGNPYHNIHRAINAGHALLEKGYAPFIPHLNVLWEIVVGEQPVQVWRELDLEYLAICDCTLRLDGVSPGADGEVAKAREFGQEVYYSLDSLCAREPVTREMLSPYDVPVRTCIHCGLKNANALHICSLTRMMSR